MVCTYRAVDHATMVTLEILERLWNRPIPKQHFLQDPLSLCTDARPRFVLIEPAFRLLHVSIAYVLAFQHTIRPVVQLYRLEVIILKQTKVSEKSVNRLFKRALIECALPTFSE